MLVRVAAGSGDGWGGKVGGEMHILNKKFYFVHVTIFKFLSNMKVNSKIFKVKIPVRGGYCTCRPTAPRNLATPWMLGFKFTLPGALPAGKDTPLLTEWEGD